MTSKFLSPLVLILAGWSLSLSAAPELAFTEEGLRVESGSMGVFHLDYPALIRKGSPSLYKIIGKTPDRTKGTVEYEGGAVLTASLTPDGTVSYAFSQVPADVKELRFNMLIDFSYQQGGKWKMDKGEETPFPVDKPAKPHLFQDHVRRFQISNYESKSLAFVFPEYTYLELQDNREWNWSTYGLVAHVPFNPDQGTYTISITPGAADPAAKTVTLVDEFGQTKILDWPDKVKSLDELKADAKNEADYYASFHPPTFDSYGGLPGSGAKLGLQKTGFFHVEKKGEQWWLVDPEGNLFFHLGVCCFAPGDDYTTVEGRRSAYDWLPPLESEFKTAFRPESGDKVFSFHTANMIRKTGKPYVPEEFTATMIDRVRKWGFNSIGAFSPIHARVYQDRNFPYVCNLPLDAWAGKIKPIPGVAGAWDPFDPAMIAQVQANFAKSLPPRADEPLVIGYFLSNEPLYEDLPKVIPGLKGSTWACKRELVRMLEEKYQTIAAFQKAWDSTAASFADLNDTALAVTTQAASDDLHQFTGRFFEAYYKLIAETFHQHDSHHMLIGSRLQPGTINSEQLCRTAGKYLDIMSLNYYTDAVDKDFLNRIYGWTGRPMFLSEFYWSANKESGLAGGREASTQLERGLAYRNYVEQTASLGYIVGIEWFTLIDQAATGRWFSGMVGERANSGLFSVTDRPWKPMVAEMSKTNDAIYDVLTGAAQPYVFHHPRFTQSGDSQKTSSVPRATGPITIDGTTKNWPGIPPEVISGKHLVMGSESGGVEGSFKLCWDDQYLYVLASIVDPTPLHNPNKKPSVLWDGDALELFIGSEKLDAGGALLFSDRHLLVSAGAGGKAAFYDPQSPEPYACETLLVPGGDGRSYTLEIAVPWTALSVKPVVGTELLFDLAIDDSTDGSMRHRQITWSGTDKNSSDRTRWGRIKLLP